MRRFLMPVLWCLGAAAGAAELTQPVAVYGIGDWSPELDGGNHRAVLRVDAPAPAVAARIPWRRRDDRPETKAVRVTDAAGNRILNVLTPEINREYGDIIFEPAAGAGSYYVYYLPFHPPEHHFAPPGEYFPPEATASPEWAETARNGVWPRAEVERLEAIADFHRFDPMEVAATAAETEQLRRECPPGRRFMVFAEDRTRPIKMADLLPADWIIRGEAPAFAGAMRPHENYAFQLGVWAAAGEVEDLQIRWSGFTAASGGTIPAEALSCLNRDGTGPDGVPFTKRIDIPFDRVQPLWFFLTAPSELGEYHGVITLNDLDVPVTLTVAGEPLADGGVGAPELQTRLGWLNSTIGLGEEVIPPFTPLAVAGDRVGLLGREIEFNALGLPEHIRAGGRELLARPVDFAVTAGGRPVVFAGAVTTTAWSTAQTLRRRTVADAPEAHYEAEMTLEAEGFAAYRIRLTARRDLELDDVALVLSMPEERAPYLMGFGARGGYRPERWTWRWDVERADNLGWLGGVDGGIQLKLDPARDVWDPVSLKDAGLPEGWHNGGRGGAALRETDGVVILTAFSGERVLRAGETLTFGFRFLITPLKPLQLREHWSWRHGADWGIPGANRYIYWHAAPGAWHINYPFLDQPLMRRVIQEVGARGERVDAGRLNYAGNTTGLTWRSGSVKATARIDFRPEEGIPFDARGNHAFWSWTLPGGDALNVFWCVDFQGLRTYLTRNMSPGGDPAGPFVNSLFMDVPLTDWRQGDEHEVEIAWHDGTIRFFADGAMLAERAYDPGRSSGDPAGGMLTFGDPGFSLARVELPGLTDDFAADAVIGELQGETVVSGGWLNFGSRRKPVDIEIYYTVRELSNYAAEMWPLRSLGDEIFAGSAFVYSVYNSEEREVDGGGYPWLIEHLKHGYVPAWMHPLGDGRVDASIATRPLSRWHNYYLEGLRWLMREFGISGLYLDGVGYDRRIMRRVARTMYEVNPAYHINLHSGNNYDFLNRRCNALNNYMELLPYITDLWLGELFDYSSSPDYWLVELSGLPFGLTGEQLNGSNAGNFFRGMIYGMSWRQERQPEATAALWRLWDDFGIEESEMIGYWDGHPAVATGSDQVYATAYKADGRALVVLAHWPPAVPRSGNAEAGKLDKAVRIDGKIDPDEWHHAARLTNFSVHNSARLASLQTEALVGWDDEYLYFGFRCHGYESAPHSGERTRDGELWLDDAVEIFIRPRLDGDEYYQFIGNAAGAIYDGRGFGPGSAAWNGHWRYASGWRNGVWEGEAAVPLADFGLTAGELATGHRIGFNMANDRLGGESSVWAPVFGLYHDVNSFGNILLGEGVAPTVQEMADSAGAVECRPEIDYGRLGLDPDRTRITIPEIGLIQAGRGDDIAPEASLTVPAGQGLFLWLEETPR